MPDPIKYYLDEHVHPGIASGLRRRGADIVTTGEAKLLGASDAVQLAWALSQSRVIFTQDTDFFGLHALGHHHAGIVYAPQSMGIGDIVHGLMLIIDVLSSNEIAGKVEFL